MRKKKLDQLIGDLLKEPVGRRLLKALKLQYLAGISTFKPETTLRVIEKIYNHPVSGSQVRSRLRRLADSGFLKQLDGKRYELRQLFLGGDVPFYRRRSSTYKRHMDEMIWLSVEAEDADPIFEMAEAAVKKGDFKQARALLKKLVDTGDRIVRGQIYHNLATMETAASRPDQARFYYREAFKQGARGEFLYADFARFKARFGGLDGAIALLNEGVLMHGKSAAIHDLLAGYYLQKGDRWKSEFHRFRAVVLESDFVPVKAGIADQLAQNGDLKGAARLYKEAARSARRHCYPLYRLAYIYANRLGEAGMALSVFDKIKRIQPGDKLAARNIELIEKGKLPLPEMVECVFRKRKLVWKPARPGVVEVVRWAEN